MGHSFSTTKPNDTPLLQPSIEGNLSLIKKLVGQHIASYDSNPSQPPTAPTQHDPELQRFVNASNAEGNTPLIGACFSGHLDVCQFLIQECGGDVTLQNNIGCNAIWIAAGYGHVSILEYFIESIIIQEEDALELICKANSSGDTPFIAAASRDYLRVCEVLLSGITSCQGDGNMNQNAYRLLCAENKAGDTALAVAVGAGYEGPLLKFLLDSEEMYSSRLKENGEENVATRPLHSKSCKGLTPLLVACERSHTNIVKELIKRGAEYTADSNGRSPLAVASFCGCIEVVAYLLTIDTGLLNTLDDNECSPLWLAARTGNAKMVKALLEAGADDSLKNKDGLSPEEAALKFKKQAVIDVFEERRRVEILDDE